MAVRSYTVDCVDHGPMVRDEPRKAWKCADCPAWLPDEDVYRLVTRVPADSPDPVPIVVT
jgi:hypothetical protein